MVSAGHRPAPVARPGPARVAPPGRVRAVLLVLPLALLLAGTAPAQPVTVFELDDYLDPRALGSTVNDDLQFEGGRSFLLLETVFGTVSDLQYEGTFTEGRTDFLQAALRYYAGRHQWNLSATLLDPAEPVRRIAPAEGLGEDRPPLGGPQPILPDHRLELQYARYQVMPEGEEASVSRGIYTVAWEDGPAGDVLELGFTLDVTPDFLRQEVLEPGFLGSLGYDWRSVENGFDQHRVLYLYSWSNEHWDDWAAPVRFSFGGEKTESHWRWAPFRVEMGVQVPIRPLDTTLYLTWAPSYRLASRGFEEGWNHELAVFLNPVVLTRLWTHRDDRR